MARAKLSVRTFTTHRRSAAGPWSSRRERSLIKQREEQFRCCSLIYKLPIFRMVGASARYSCLHTPVETGTPPYRQSKLRILRFRLAAEGCVGMGTGLLFGIVTHFGVEVCYNSVTFFNRRTWPSGPPGRGAGASPPPGRTCRRPWGYRRHGRAWPPSWR